MTLECTEWSPQLCPTDPQAMSSINLNPWQHHYCLVFKAFICTSTSWDGAQACLLLGTQELAGAT